MTTATEVQTTRVYQVFIKATPEQIWDAITKPEFTSKYFYSRVSWEIEPQDGGVATLTVVHHQLEASTKTAFSVAGGWPSSSAASRRCSRLASHSRAESSVRRPCMRGVSAIDPCPGSENQGQ
jgi:hypothetical protein